MCWIPAWLSLCPLPLVVWQCFSGPLIQYGHFTVRHNAQGKHSFPTGLAGLQGAYRMRWAVVGGPRCRNQAQILPTGQSKSPWA